MKSRETEGEVVVNDGSDFEVMFEKRVLALGSHLDRSIPSLRYPTAPPGWIRGSVGPISVVQVPAGVGTQSQAKIPLLPALNWD